MVVEISKNITLGGHLRHLGQLKVVRFLCWRCFFEVSSSPFVSLGLLEDLTGDVHVRAYCVPLMRGSLEFIYRVVVSIAQLAGAASDINVFPRHLILFLLFAVFFAFLLCDLLLVRLLLLRHNRLGWRDLWHITRLDILCLCTLALRMADQFGLLLFFFWLDKLACIILF